MKIIDPDRDNERLLDYYQIIQTRKFDDFSLILSMKQELIKWIYNNNLILNSGVVSTEHWLILNSGVVSTEHWRYTLNNHFFDFFTNKYQISDKKYRAAYALSELNKINSNIDFVNFGDL